MKNQSPQAYLRRKQAGVQSPNTFPSGRVAVPRFEQGFAVTTPTRRLGKPLTPQAVVYIGAS